MAKDCPVTLRATMTCKRPRVHQTAVMTGLSLPILLSLLAGAPAAAREAITDSRRPTCSSKTASPEALLVLLSCSSKRCTSNEATGAPQQGLENGLDLPSGAQPQDTLLGTRTEFVGAWRLPFASTAKPCGAQKSSTAADAAMPDENDDTGDDKEANSGETPLGEATEFKRGWELHDLTTSISHGPCVVSKATSHGPSLPRTISLTWSKIHW